MTDLPQWPHFLNPSTNNTIFSSNDPVKHTQSPIVTGTSILGIKYEGGVMLASDTLGSYGSLARFKDLKRMRPVGDYTAVGGSGEYSDFQYIMDTLQKRVDHDFCMDDGTAMYPKEIYQYLVRILYNRRNKFDPLWNSLVIAGYRDGKAFLGMTDLVGTHFEENTVATGYGSYIAQPLLRKFYEEKNGKLTKDEAKQILEKCLEVLFYRDCRTINKIQVADVSKDGVNISEPYSLETKWTYQGF